MQTDFDTKKERTDPFEKGNPVSVGEVMVGDNGFEPLLVLIKTIAYVMFCNSVTSRKMLKIYATSGSESCEANRLGDRAEVKLGL
jgi:hypothetical protein